MIDLIIAERRCLIKKAKQLKLETSELLEESSIIFRDQELYFRKNSHSVAIRFLNR